MATQSQVSQAQATRLSTGITGLDEILEGGLVAGRSYLVRGGPGCGKTTLGLHFLTCGSSAGEPVLFISLAETEAQLRDNADRFGLDLNGVNLLDLSPDAAFFSKGQSYDIFSSAEVERGPVTDKIVEEVVRLRPKRVFIDSVTQLRYLASDPFQFRKQTLSFLRFLAGHEATVLLTSEGTPEAPDDDLRFIADGVIELESTREGRTVMVTKFRGSNFNSGPHTLRIGAWGLTVFPRLVPETHRRERKAEVIASGVPELDQMLSGGLERGTVTIITGPTGVGKTTLGLVFMKEAAGRGERSVVYTFEESPETLFSRCEGINIPVRAMVERGTLFVLNVEPLQYSPDEFARMVQFKVEELNCRIVMIDSISGYSLSLRGGDPVRPLHGLSKYLSNMGVTTLLVNEVEAITGEFRVTDIGISYLADNVIFLRYLEIDGELQKGIGVLKKRLSDFEKFVRRVEITRFGVKVGEPFAMRGVLSGAPGSAVARPG